MHSLVSTSRWVKDDYGSVFLIILAHPDVILQYNVQL